MTKKKATANASASKTGGSPESTAARPATARRKVVIAIVGCTLAAIFLVSFIYRTQHQSLQVQRRPQTASHGDSGANAMPPGMGADSQMMNDIGKLMEQMRDKPDDFDLLMQLADRFITMQAWDKAELFLTRAMVAAPSNPDVLYKLGIAAFQQNKAEDAAGYFEEIVNQHPDHAHAQLNLGILYKHYLNKPEQAVARFQAVLGIADAPQALVEEAEKELSAPEHNKTEQ